MTMRKVGRFVAWAVGLFAASLAAASMWFWFTPVGLNNYINKITLQLTFDSPQLLTQLGFIDNTLFDFHSGKLDNLTREYEEEVLARLRVQASTSTVRKGLPGRS
jgi:hypothetical protein